MTGPLPALPCLPAPAAAPPLDPALLGGLQNNAQLGQLLPSLFGAAQPATGGGSAQLAGLLQSLSGGGAMLGGGALSAGQPPPGGEEARRDGGGPTSSAPRARPARASSEPRPANSYNARHQQAEARRRSRINERLEALRQLVPHTERANTANFLEEVVTYVQRLQGRVVELERQLGINPSVQISSRPITFADDTPEQTMQTGQRDDRHAALSQPLAMPLSAGQQLPLPMHDPAVQAAALAALLQQQQQQAQQQVQQQAQQQQLQVQQQAQLQLLLQQHAAAVAAQQQQQQAQSFPLKLPPQPPQPQQQMPQATSSGSRLLLPSCILGAGGAADSAGDRQQSAGLLALAAADSVGAMSGGEGASMPPKGGSAAATAAAEDGAAAGAAGQAPRSPQPQGHAGPGPAPAQQQQQQQQQPFKRAQDLGGIPTDEELDSLHLELSAQQDSKRRRLVGA